MREYIRVTEDENNKFNFWRVKHNRAVLHPEAGPELAIISLLDGIEEYRFRHRIRYDSEVEDDGVLAEGVSKIAEGVRVLLNGEIGRLDAGTIDGYLVKLLERCGVEV